MERWSRLYAKSLLKRSGLLPAAWHLQRWARLASRPAERARELAIREEFVRFRRQYARALGSPVANGRLAKTVLVVSVGFPSGVQAELGLIKGLQLAGFHPVVIAKRDPWLVKYYALVGIERVFWWDVFVDPLDGREAEAVLTRLRSSEELRAFTHAGAHVGRFTASTALRNLRVGALDIASLEIKRRLVPYLAASMAYAVAAQRLLRAVRPQAALFVDRGYTPQGELFDACLAAGVDVMTWNAAHRSNTLMLKRYAQANRDEHPASLSEESWALLREPPWTETHRCRLVDELERSYASGDWYSEVGTQFRTRLLKAREVKHRLGLDPNKKTALIFSHILWDATFFWGTDLFRNYEEWFIETVRAASANRNVNWVIKVHPANVVKDVRDGIRGEPSELTAIRKQIGQLPPHVFIIPADSDINTFSLFGLMDYCLTVRGTIGIEAACFGIPVLTAGTGRYDHKGFTIDSESREEYLERLARIQEIPPLLPGQQELAERFAYALFVLRILPLTTFTLEYQKDATASIHTRINAVSQEDWLAAPDLKAFAEWVARTDQLDFLSPLPDSAGKDVVVNEANGLVDIAVADQPFGSES